MFKPVHAIAAAVSFRVTMAPRMPVVRRHADACPRPTLQARWVRVMAPPGVPCLELRGGILDPATSLGPDASLPVLAFAA